jgi:hypothetical protein
MNNKASAHDRDFATQWARTLLNTGNFCIFDVALTSTNKDTAQICQLALIDETGTILLHSLVCPSTVIELSARALHGISDRDVGNMATFEELLVPLLKKIGTQSLVLYNIGTLITIKRSLAPFGIELAFPVVRNGGLPLFLNGRSIHAVQPKYELWLGCNAPDSLIANALDNCRATLSIIRQMATEGEAA